MIEIGYTLSSEEHDPLRLVDLAVRAEDAGFGFALISDHYHPWVDAQGHSPFVWGLIGAIGQRTERLRLGTGVTCPTIRIHPAIVAQAAATSAILMGGRFFLGVGTGENLNEHITGARWPSPPERLEMLEEAIGILRDLWTGEELTHRGRHYRVDHARLYTVPSEPPPVHVAAAGPRSAELAATHGDGLIATSPDPDLVRRFRSAGGAGEVSGKVTVSWADDEAIARRVAFESWPNAGLEGELGQELPLPRHFEQATSMLHEDDIAEAIVCGPDPDRHIAAIQAYIDAGFDRVFVHQVGPQQEGFFDFYRSHVLTRFEQAA